MDIFRVVLQEPELLRLIYPGSVLTATQLVDLESQQINILLDHKSVMPFGIRGGISVRYK